MPARVDVVASRGRPPCHRRVGLDLRHKDGTVPTNRGGQEGVNGARTSVANTAGQTAVG